MQSYVDGGKVRCVKVLKPRSFDLFPCIWVFMTGDWRRVRQWLPEFAGIKPGASVIEC
jgi:hypothetical protein